MGAGLGRLVGASSRICSRPHRRRSRPAPLHSRLAALLHWRRSIPRDGLPVGAAQAANRAVTHVPPLVACGAAAFAPCGAPTLAGPLTPFPAPVPMQERRKPRTRRRRIPRDGFPVGAAQAANRAVGHVPPLVACGTAAFAPCGAPTLAGPPTQFPAPVPMQGRWAYSVSMNIWVLKSAVAGRVRVGVWRAYCRKASA
jgi:hypothetical protein